MPETKHKQRSSTAEGRFRLLRRLACTAAPILLALVAGCIGVHVHLANPPQSPVNIVYDDDCDGDIDCAVTQPILNHWIDLGYVKVWGMVSSGHSRLGAPTLRLFRDYYGHSNLYPVGAWTPGCEANQSAPWNVAVVNKFDSGDTCANYPSCTRVLRESVAQYVSSGASQGLDYVITGPLTCEEAFRNSPPDTISPLTGEQMEQRYVRQFVVMNGKVPAGAEYNCQNDVSSCAAFFAHVTAANGYPPVYTVPINTGAEQVKTEVPVSSLPASNPTAYAFASQTLSVDSDEDSMAL